MASIQLPLVVGTQRGVFVLRPGQEISDSEIVAQALPTQDVVCLALDPTGGLYAGAANGLVHHSRDAVTWKPLLDGLDNPGIWSLAVHPGAPGVLFAGVSPAAIFRRDDVGQPWRRLRSFNKVPGADRWAHPLPPYLPRARTMVFHPDMPDALFVGVKTGGVLATLDGGQTWNERQKGVSREVNQLLIHPAASARLLAATDGGFYRSEDLGGSWTALNQGLPYTFVRCLACDDANPELIVAGVNRTESGMGASLFRSSNGGGHWEISEGLPPMPTAMVTTVACSGGGFFAGTDKGDIFGTADFAEHWQRLDSNLPPINVILTLA